MWRSCKPEILLVSTLLYLGALAMSTAWAKQFIELEGARFPTQQPSEVGLLDLQGAGLLKWGIWFDVYAAAYYVDRTDPRHRKLVIEYFVPIEARQIKSAAEAHLRKQLGQARFDALKPALDRLHAAMEAVGKGDRYALIQQRKQELILQRNGSEMLRLREPDLGRAYFDLWLGEDPLDPGLRLSLLGAEGQP